MTLPFSVHDDAELELNEAADFYDLENPGLGSSQIDEFEWAVATIREHPEAGPVVLGRARRWGCCGSPTPSSLRCVNTSCASSQWHTRSDGHSTGAVVGEVGLTNGST